MSDTRSLPLIPLEDGIVLPGMAFVFELVSPDANVAVDEVGPDGQVVLVPKIDGRFARVGVVADVEGEPVLLPGGHRGVTLRALHRAELGRADASGGALRIDVTERPDSTEITDELAEQMRAYRAVIESILEARDRGRVIAVPARPSRSRARWPTRPASRPTSRSGRSSSCSRRSTSSERLEKATAWARDVLGEIELKRRIRDDVTEGMEKSQREFLLRRQLDAIRKELGEDGESDEIARYRERIAETDLPEEARKEAERELVAARDRRRRAPRAPPSAPISTGCWPCRGAVTQRRAQRRARGPRDPRGRPRRPEGRQGAHPRVPGGAQVPARARHRGRAPAA